MRDMPENHIPKPKFRAIGEGVFPVPEGPKQPPPNAQRGSTKPKPPKTPAPPKKK